MKSDYPVAITIENETSLISPLVERLVDEAESVRAIVAADRYKMVIALAEALTNAIVHGNLEVSSDLREFDISAYQSVIDRRRRMAPYCHRQVEIKCHFIRDCATVQITDEGPGFDLSSLTDPTRTENLQRLSGRGIAMMCALLDEVHFNDDGNSVTLIKYAQCFQDSDEFDLKTQRSFRDQDIELPQRSWTQHVE